MNFKVLLRENKFSLTRSRLSLLETLERASIPMSEKEIEKKMRSKYNRTTIYRNLNSLSEKGILQRILSDDCIKYKLIQGSHANKSDSDHIHFQCRECNRVICMEDLKIVDYPLPEGYNKLENQFLIVGICRECNES